MSFLFDDLTKRLFEAFAADEERFCAIRRYLHQHPEPSGQEKTTAEYLSRILTSAGIPHTMGLAGNGIAALVKGGSGPVVALRGDMDALEIAEETKLPYASVSPGLMHACGHDFHMAGVLIAGLLLHSVRGQLPGSVKLLFQPAEEGGPPGGAQPMIDAGVLENPHVEAIFGCHVFPHIPKGVIALREGAIMAAVDNFYITVTGRGGHAAYPHMTRDPVPAAAQIILGLSVLVSRTVAASESAVISVGKIEGGTRRNIIPDSVRIEGTMRTLRGETRASLRHRVEQMCRSICTAHGIKCKIEMQQSFSETINDDGMTRLACRAIRRTLGENAVHWEKEANMGGEDFGAFLRVIPGSFYFVGCREDVPMDLHNARLCIADSVLGNIVRAHIAVVLNYFDEWSK
jgi:amidohydrolase